MLLFVMMMMTMTVTMTNYRKCSCATELPTRLKFTSVYIMRQAPKMQLPPDCKAFSVFKTVASKTLNTFPVSFDMPHIIATNKNILNSFQVSLPHQTAGAYWSAFTNFSDYFSDFICSTEMSRRTPGTV